MRIIILTTILLVINTCTYNKNIGNIYTQEKNIALTAHTALQSIPSPIKADAKTIFYAQPQSWRQKAYEVYRLIQGNNLIVISFLNYDEQRKFFFRLTYFSNQNKQEYDIKPADYYKGMHSYNANDYSAKDIADYFNQLAKQHMEPEEGETILLQMALAYKLLKKSGTGYVPLSGALVSFSLETEIKQRKRYLIHETMHGLFFTVSGLREEIFSIVNNLTPDEKRFWNLFLENKGRLDSRPGLSGYNISNSALVANEIFAHIMQNEPEYFDIYFFEIYIPRMIKLLPEEKEFLENFIKTNKNMFLELRRKFSQALEKHCSLKDGVLL